MKKIIASLLAVLLVMSFASVVMADEVPGNLGKSYTAGKATVVVDGVVDEIWAAVEATKIDVPYDQAYPDPNFNFFGTNVEAKILYDDQYIYFLIIAENADAFSKDTIEIYVNESEPTEGEYGELAYQMRVTYDAEYAEDGLYTVAGTNPTEYADDEIVAQKALVLSNDNKTATMEFAFKRLNPDVKDGATIGVEFMYEDYGVLDGIECTLNIFRWNIAEVDANGDATGITRPWQETMNFGKLVLGPKAEIATATPAPTEAPAADNTADEPANNTWIFVVVGVVVVAAVVAVVVVVSKKKN